MKKPIIILFLLSAQLSVAARDMDSIFIALDNTILHKHAYNRSKELELSVLREKMSLSRNSTEKLANSLALSFAYFTYQNDSAMYYVRRAYEYAQVVGDRRSHIEAQILQANIFRAMGQFIEASEILNKLQDQGIPKEVKYKYYIAKRLNYNALRGYSVSASEKGIYNDMAISYRDSLLNDRYAPDIQRFLAEIERLLFDKDYSTALDLALSGLDKISPTELDKDPGILLFHISDIYGKLGDHDSELYYLAKAAIEDIRYSSRSYVALRKLANFLYEGEQVNRAYNYMKCHIEDAQASNERYRLFESANIFLDINRAFQTKELEQKKIITRGLTLLTIVALFLAAAIIYIACQFSRMKAVKENLSKTNGELIKANQKLKDANHIKIEYIRLYMEQHLKYLSLIESYKNKAGKIARVEGTMALLEFVESSMDTQSELDDFYEHFDTTLLNLFPNFVDEFNALLMPAQQETLKENHRLTLGLRIFGLIRLGVTNSIDIARFLQYSLSTIYTYRTRMRNRAIDRDSFEKQVMKIGINNF